MIQFPYYICSLLVFLLVQTFFIIFSSYVHFLFKKIIYLFIFIFLLLKYCMVLPHWHESAATGILSPIPNPLPPPISSLRVIYFKEGSSQAKFLVFCDNILFSFPRTVSPGHNSWMRIFAHSPWKFFIYRENNLWMTEISLVSVTRDNLIPTFKRNYKKGYCLIWLSALPISWWGLKMRCMQALPFEIFTQIYKVSLHIMFLPLR